MPAKNTKRVKSYLTPAQIDAVQATEPGNISNLIRRLLKAHVETNGGRWPEHPGRGEHPRIMDDHNPKSTTVST